MKVAQYCKRNVIAINADADIVEAAKLMRTRHVGFLVVLDQEDARHIPVGVLTDRDIVVQVDALEADRKALRVGDVMTRKPIVAWEHDDLLDIVQSMRRAGIRRAPVVDAAGILIGVIAVDDVIDIVTGLLSNVAGAIRNEQKFERDVHFA